MIKQLTVTTLVLAGLSAVVSAAGNPESNVTCYPRLDGLAACAEFTVEANGRPVWVEAVRRPIPDYAPRWFRRQSADLRKDNRLAVNIASFGCSGPCALTIKPATNGLIEWLDVEPHHRNIAVTRKGNEFTLALPGPCHLQVRMGDNKNNRLADFLIFAEPPEKEVPPANDPRTRVFGPGVHQAGLITLKDNDRLYLAPGAIVYGGLRGSPHGAKVFGRGILDGSRIDQNHMIRLTDAANVEFEGITIRCGKLDWLNRLDRCENFVYRNVKLLSFINQGDGIDPCNSRNILIEDCFLRCADDCISVKAFTRNGFTPNVSNIVVRGCVMAGYGFSDGFTVGIECDTERMEDILVQDCDILQARGGNAFGGHAAFSVNCDGPADIRNVRFEDIRVGSNVRKNCQFAINNAKNANKVRKECKPPDAPYLAALPGHIKGVSVKNVQWEGASPIILYGYDAANQVENVTFEGCTVAGKALTSAQIQKRNKWVGNVAVSAAASVTNHSKD